MHRSNAQILLLIATIGLALLFLFWRWLADHRNPAEETMTQWAQRIEKENRSGHQFGVALLAKREQPLLLIDTRSVVPGEHRAQLKWLTRGTPAQVVRSLTYGASPGVIGRALLEAPDGDLFLLGEKKEVSEAYRGWVTRLTPDGAVRWEKSLGQPGVTGLRAGWVTPDGGLLAIGSHGFQGWAVRLDARGDVRWSKLFPELQRLTAVIADRDDRVLVLGQIEVSTSGPGRAAVLALHLDGQQAWLRDLSDAGHIDLEAAAPLATGAVLLVGQRATESGPRLWAARFESESRSLAWQLEHGQPGELTAARDAIVHSAGDLIVVGRVMTAQAERKILVLGFEPMGRVKWERRLGGEDDHATALGEQPDGELLVTGSGQGRGPGKTQALLWHIAPTGHLRAEQFFAAP